MILVDAKLIIWSIVLFSLRGVFKWISMCMAMTERMCMVLVERVLDITGFLSFFAQENLKDFFWERFGFFINRCALLKFIRVYFVFVSEKFAIILLKKIWFSFFNRNWIFLDQNRIFLNQNFSNKFSSVKIRCRIFKFPTKMIPSQRKGRFYHLLGFYS